MPCTCGHSTRTAPTTQREALTLVGHWRTIEDHLEPVAKADGKWMAVWRCKRCMALWAEDEMSSGHASLQFIYPIETEDPVAWLAADNHLWLPAG